MSESKRFKTLAAIARVSAVCGLIALASCKRAAVEKQPAGLLAPPMATGVTIATVDITPPAGNANRVIAAALKRGGHIVARGEATIPERGNVQVVLKALDETAAVPDGEYELSMTINRDGLVECNPSFGDLFVRQKWELHKGTRAKTFSDPNVWKERKFSKKENLLTIHYHRYDEDYTDVGIWTWDAHYKKTPEQNEIYPVGRDDYGLIYQLDRAEYGHSDKIGLLPRPGLSWDRKDGDDKFWSTALGNEIWLVGTKNQIFTKRPDTSPQVAAAFLDAQDRLVVQLSRLADATVLGVNKISVVDDQNRRVAVATTRLMLEKDKTRSNYIELKTVEPLDIAHRAYKISVAGFAGEAQAVPRGVLDDPALFCETNAVLGATYTKEATTFRVFAPTARAVNVVLYEDAVSDAGRKTYPLQAAPKGIWEGAINGDLEGKFYLYNFDGENLSPEREVLDISAINSVNSQQRARLTDLSKTDPPNWQTDKRGPTLGSAVDAVIYEIHVRDFSIAPNSGIEHKGKYLGFAEAGTHLPDDPAVKTGLDHLSELGITHVQLLPIQDFENDETSTNYNWGYVTTVYNSPDGWYATNVKDESRIREFKQLVAALHQRGIGVIMDVVYNHTAGGAPFNFIVPQYYYRHWPDGSLSNGSGCGNEFRSESPMGRKYILDSLKYWAQEYGIDGFRFDLMALIDLDTIKLVEQELRKINPNIIIYGEPWPAGKTPLRNQTTKLTIHGTKIGAFNDNIRNALVGSPFDKGNAGFIQGGNNSDDLLRCVEGSWRIWSEGPYQAINYMSCHDNWVVWDKLKHTNPNATDDELIDMMKLGYLLLFTSQGVPFLHGGEEFARTKQGHENSYNAPDEINELDWSLKKKHHDLFEYTRALIALRKAHPIFRLRAREQIAAWLKPGNATTQGQIMYTLDGSAVEGEPWKKVCLLANSADQMSAEVTLPEGKWFVGFDHDGVGDNREIEGTARVRYKSGMILYQP